MSLFCTWLRKSAVAATVVFLGGCGASGDLSHDLSAASGDYIVVDLTTMAWTAQASVPDLQTNPVYRDQYVVFRSVVGGNSKVGSADSGFGHQTDEELRNVQVERVLIGVFELTQAQWLRLSPSSTPWTSLPPSLVGVADATKPAVGLTFQEITSTLAGLTVPAFQLRLPAPVEWERACAGGSTTTFSWGEARDDTTVGTYAVVSETAGASVGPRPVGLRSGNGYGLFDMHGNVWEWTNTGDLRGGSWRDSLSSARRANQLALDPMTSHPLVGARLVLEFR